MDTRAATDELPDRTRWALDAYAALLLDRRLAQQTLLTLDAHIAEAEGHVKAAAAADGVTARRLGEARTAMAAATGLDVAGTSSGPAMPRSTAKRATRTPAAARAGATRASRTPLARRRARTG